MCGHFLLMHFFTVTTFTYHPITVIAATQYILVSVWQLMLGAPIRTRW